MQRTNQLAQEATSNPQALVDLEARIEEGIVNESLPTDGGAGLLEVDPHDHAQIILQPFRHLLQLLRCSGAQKETISNLIDYLRSG